MKWRRRYPEPVVALTRVVDLDGDTIELRFYRGAVRALTLEPTAPMVAEVGATLTFRVTSVERVVREVES